MSSARVGCLLLPGFSLGTLAGVIDPLAQAAALHPGRIPEPLMLSLDGRPVRSGSGAWVVCTELRAAPPLLLAMVVSDLPWHAHDPQGPGGPMVYELTIPRSQSTSNIIAIVQSMMFSPY
ncbi:MAG: hypothetical protein J0M20_12895 [Burkholderiales bacterium]|nr:hypothetical protein [Burkholderiales bacterium]